MKLEADVKKLAKQILKNALRQTNSSGELTNLKLLFPGCDDILLRLAALMTDIIPDESEVHTSLIENAIAEATATFTDSMEEWYAGNINIHEVLARYTYALFNRSSAIALWAVELKGKGVWEYPNPKFLASEYDAIVDVRPRSRPVQLFQTTRLLDELLTDREKRMMRLDQFLEAQAV